MSFCPSVEPEVVAFPESCASDFSIEGNDEEGLRCIEGGFDIEFFEVIEEGVFVEVDIESCDIEVIATFFFEEGNISDEVFDIFRSCDGVLQI